MQLGPVVTLKGQVGLLDVNLVQALLILGLPIVAATAFLAGGAVRDTTAVGATGRAADAASDDMAGVRADTPSGLWRQIAVTFAALFILSAGVAGWALLRPEPPRPVLRVSVQIPEDQFFNASRGDFDLSSDGSLMVYRGEGDGVAQLWAKRWDALDATPIRDTDGAFRPAISPDGRQVAFRRGRSIPVVPLEGGVSRMLTESAGANGSMPRWSPDGDWIYYTDASQGLSRMPSDGGGTAEPITEGGH